MKLQLPKGWKEIKLQETSEIIRGVTYDGNSVKELPTIDHIPIMRAGNINQKIIYDDYVYVPQKYVSKKQLLKKGDILIATSSGSKNIVGKSAQIDKEDGNISFGAFCCVIRPKNIDSKYMKFYFKSKHYKLFVKQTMKGININNLRISEIRNLLIPVPPTDIQKNISMILGKAEKIKEMRNESDELTEELMKSIFIEMFGEASKNNKMFKILSLGELLTESPQNGLYKHFSEYTTDGDGIPILRIDSFYDGKLKDISNLKRLNCNQKELKLFKLENKNIVINRVNSIEFLGKCALIEGLKEKTVFESNMMRLKVNEEIINSTFLTFFLCTRYLKSQILSKAKKAVNQASINQEDVKSLKIIVPPIKLQNKFEKIVRNIKELQEQQQKSKIQSDNLFNNLMQKSFKGEVIC